MITEFHDQECAKVYGPPADPLGSNLDAIIDASELAPVAPAMPYDPDADPAWWTSPFWLPQEWQIATVTHGDEPITMNAGFTGPWLADLGWS